MKKIKLLLWSAVAATLVLVAVPLQKPYKAVGN